MEAVTKESLAKRIAELASGPRSLKEDYQLEAYLKLLRFMKGYAKLGYVIYDFEDDECDHEFTVNDGRKNCLYCGESL